MDALKRWLGLESGSGAGSYTLIDDAPDTSAFTSLTETDLADMQTPDTESLVKGISPMQRRRGLSKQLWAALSVPLVLLVAAILTSIIAPLNKRECPTIRVMVVGDSISQGFEADYTWRFRLWEWLHDNCVTVDFVGPYVGTLPQPVATPPSPPPFEGEKWPEWTAGNTGHYAKGVSKSFSQHHFAVWGRQAIQIKDLNQMVATYEPEYLLMELGINDLLAHYSPGDTLKSIEGLVSNARAAKPNLKFAVANIPMRAPISGQENLTTLIDQYNALLRNAIPTWSTPKSPIAEVLFRESYTCE
jgi:hypothetical protein